MLENKLGSTFDNIPDNISSNALSDTLNGVFNDASGDKAQYGRVDSLGILQSSEE